MILVQTAQHHSIAQTRKLMHRILYIFDDSGAAVVLPHRITQTRTCMEFYTFSMILEPPAPRHSITQYRKCMEFFVFSMILEPPGAQPQSRKCTQFNTFLMILQPPALPKPVNSWNSVHFQGFRSRRRPTTALPKPGGNA